MVALVPLAFADMRRSWSPTIHAYDASLKGFGVARAQANAEVVGDVGRVRERFRFLGGGSHKPREAAEQRGAETKLDVEVAGFSEQDALRVGESACFREVPADLVEDCSWSTVFGGNGKRRHRTLRLWRRLRGFGPFGTCQEIWEIIPSGTWFWGTIFRLYFQDAKAEPPPGSCFLQSELLPLCVLLPTFGSRIDGS